MDSLPAIEGAAPPRLVRAVCLQMLALAGIALVSALPWTRVSQPSRQRPIQPKKQERRIRIVQLPKPPPPQPARPPAQPAAPAQPAQPVAARPPPASRNPAPAPAPAAMPIARIAADSTAVHGVRMRVLIPRSPGDLAAHLRNSGGCLVMSRLSGGSAEVLSVFAVEGGQAVETGGPPCAGVPRLVRDAALNLALGDPIGRARAASPGDELVLQVLLSPELNYSAQSALRTRFGDVPEEQMARRAAEDGYELTCFAEPVGALRCE